MDERPFDQTTDHAHEALNPRRAMLAGLGGLAAGAFLASTANAGPLNPPPGPITPTPGPEPRTPISTATTPGTTNAVYRILLPGSYYLTADIIGEPGKSGIQVIAVIGGEVVIDLNGFAIRGVDGAINGITCNSANPRLVIRNGQIRDWGWQGISANCPMVLEDLRIEENHLGGASGGNDAPSQARRCVIRNNTGNGLTLGPGSTVESVISEGHTPAPSTEASGDGIVVGADCIVQNCIARANTGAGMVVGTGTAVLTSTISSNSGDGINLGSKCLVDSCTIKGNTERGIYAVGSLCRITRNLITENTRGLRLETGADNALIDENSIVGNITGMNLFAQGCTVVRNVWRANSGNNNTFVGGNNIAPFETAATSTSPWANLL